MKNKFVLPVLVIIVGGIITASIIASASTISRVGTLEEKIINTDKTSESAIIRIDKRLESIENLMIRHMERSNEAHN